MQTHVHEEKGKKETEQFLKLHSNEKSLDKVSSFILSLRVVMGIGVKLRPNIGPEPSLCCMRCVSWKMSLAADTVRGTDTNNSLCCEVSTL